MDCHSDWGMLRRGIWDEEEGILSLSRDKMSFSCKPSSLWRAFMSIEEALQAPCSHFKTRELRHRETFRGSQSLSKDRTKAP